MNYEAIISGQRSGESTIEPRGYMFEALGELEDVVSELVHEENESGPFSGQVVVCEQETRRIIETYNVMGSHCVRFLFR